MKTQTILGARPQFIKAGSLTFKIRHQTSMVMVKLAPLL